MNFPTKLDQISAHSEMIFQNWPTFVTGDQICKKISTQWLEYMLDSLVHVSRRVGGAANLLGREMRIATEHCLKYESSHVTVWCDARTPRAASRINNFTRGLRCAPNSSCRKLRGKCTRETCRPSRTVIADLI